MVCELSNWPWTLNPLPKQSHCRLHSATRQHTRSKPMHLTQGLTFFPCLFPLSSLLPICLDVYLPSFHVFAWALTEKREKKDEMESMLSLSARGGFRLYKSTGPSTASVTQPCGEITQITASLHLTANVYVYYPLNYVLPFYPPLPASL